MRYNWRYNDMVSIKKLVRIHTNVYIVNCFGIRLCNVVVSKWHRWVHTDFLSWYIYVLFMDVFDDTNVWDYNNSNQKKIEKMKAVNY